MPQGNECYYKYISENREQLTSTCVESCHGLHADITAFVTQDDTITISKNGESTEAMFAEYLDYKRGFENDYLTYFSDIIESPGSPFLNEFVTREIARCKNNYYDCAKLVKDGYAECDKTRYKCRYETYEALQVVEIYFETPTFDKITRDAKTNSIAKLSLIGGTLGLLTGK